MKQGEERKEKKRKLLKSIFNFWYITPTAGGGTNIR
jgi:hypothetical protein